MRLELLDSQSFESWLRRHVSVAAAVAVLSSKSAESFLLVDSYILKVFVGLFTAINVADCAILHVL